MLARTVRPQRSVIGVGGQAHRAWEFDYCRTTFYIQETDHGYVVVEETGPQGMWMRVRPQRSQLIVSEFERARRRERV